MKNNQLYKNYIKRIIDILVAVTFIVLFWWLLLIIAVLVRINMGSPVLYTTERVGKDERIFRIYKFRSMTNEVDENGVLLPGNKRLTKFGGLLRSTSLDELPQILTF